MTDYTDEQKAQFKREEAEHYERLRQMGTAGESPSYIVKEGNRKDRRKQAALSRFKGGSNA